LTMGAKKQKPSEKGARLDKEGYRNGYVKKETMLIVAFVALLVGFFSGVVFVSLKSGMVRQPPRQEASKPPIDAGKGFTERIAPLEDEVSRNPDNIQAWIQLGNHYFDADQPRQAIRAYERALALEDNNPDVWTDLGVMYRRDGRPQEAIEAFDKAMTLDPLHEVSRFNKGIVLMHDLNDQKGALGAWEALLAINPNAKASNGQTLRDLVERVKRDGP
jgi:cytochrome c-type biogenesis protein CcmH/NrfG